MAQKILIISPVPLFPGYAGNSARIRNICLELMDFGFELDFYYTGFEGKLESAHATFFNGKILDYAIKDVPLSAYLRIRELFNGVLIRWQRRYRRIADGPESERYNKSLYEYKNMRKISLLKRQLANRRYTAVIVNYTVYSFYFDFFDASTKRILDTHDRLSNRYKLFLENGEQPPNWHSLRPEDETRAIAKADVVWAITGEEKEHYQQLIGQQKKQISVLRHVIPFSPVDAGKSNLTILFIGSDNKLNVEGLVWFLEKIWPQLIGSVPGIRLIVAGSICNKEKLFIAPGVHIYGKYKTAEEVYQKAAVCINPMLHGTGLKIKTLEALAHGKVVLSTPEGATGLGDIAGKGLICKENPEDWVRELTVLMENPEKLREARNLLGKKIEEIYQGNLLVLKKSVGLKDVNIQEKPKKS